MVVVRRANRLDRAPQLAAALIACVTVVEHVPCSADPSEQCPVSEVKRRADGARLIGSRGGLALLQPKSPYTGFGMGNWARLLCRQRL
jgi:hypothetical protein